MENKENLNSKGHLPETNSGSDWILNWKDWYEKVVPAELIPVEYQSESVLPGGEKQITDKRWGFTYDRKKGGLVVCPEVMFDVKDSNEFGGDW